MTDEVQMDGREIADLLPWYASGRLAGRERHRVAIALASDPALQRELALILEEQTASIEGNEALGAPSRAAAARFFAVLDAERPAKTPWFDVADWIAIRVPGWRPRAIAWGTIAAAVLVLAQAGVIGELLSWRPKTYALSSVEPSPGGRNGAIVLVAFEPAASVAAVAQLLQANGASIVAGPLPGGLYRLRVGDRPLAKADVDALMMRLKAQANVIRFAAPETGPD
ncbi:hypothetical protein [Beijerinckia sp. L45]|uniref:hypothetical protein n=1 Tax=Beijerinckia sp. L45 TaxID=1641855 RepID=UPI00131E9003|nr:hypothetical protein [Beijerinckia sp. L45]